MDKVLFSFHEEMSQYDMGEGHPFRGDRFGSAVRFFEEHGLLDMPAVACAVPVPASHEDLLRVHDEGYLNRLFRLAKEGQPYDIETPISEGILNAALLIVGSAIECGTAVFEGRANRAIAVGGGYHHAGRSYGGGFCLFNDVAVLVRYLQAKYGVKRVLVLDYDVHAGNGTSDIFYRDPEVLFVDLHQDPSTFYPGTGFVHQIGEDAGEGFNVNVPLPAGTGDATYLWVLDEVFVPLAEEFRPEIVVANGGSDSHFADMLGGLALSVDGFFRVARLIREVSDRVCKGRVVLMPGSGYNPAVLPQCWYALAAGITGLTEISVKEPYSVPSEPVECRRAVERTVDELRRLLRKHWNCFGGFSLNTMP